MRLFKFFKAYCWLFITSCFLFSVSAHASNKDDAIHLKLGFVDPIGSSYALGGKKFAEECLRLSNGKVQIDIVPNGKLGGEREMFELAKKGEIDMISVVNNVLSQSVPSLKVLDKLYLFDNETEAHAAIDAISPIVSQELDTQNIHLLGWFDSGFRDVFSKNPITKVEDFKNLKIRTIESVAQSKIVQNLGAIPVPIPAHKQYEALKNGTIDACENAIGNMLTNHYYEIIKNVTNTKHLYTFIMIGVSNKTWSKIPNDIKAIIQEAMNTAVSWQRMNLTDINNDALKKLKQLGIKFHDIDINEMKKAVDKTEFAVDSTASNIVYEAIYKVRSKNSDN